MRSYICRDIRLYQFIFEIRESLPHFVKHHLQTCHVYSLCRCKILTKIKNFCQTCQSIFWTPVMHTFSRQILFSCQYASSGGIGLVFVVCILEFYTSWTGKCNCTCWLLLEKFKLLERTSLWLDRIVIF